LAEEGLSFLAPNNDDSLWGAITSIEEINLSLYDSIIMNKNDCKSPSYFGGKIITMPLNYCNK
jgi:hypothetical protein